jgi:hypothetical protein
MTDPTLVQFTFGLEAPGLQDEARLKFARQFLPELRQVEGVERANRTEEVISEAGAKGFTTLVGWLTADVSVKSITSFLTWMGCLADKPVKVKVKLGDREVELESDKLGDPEATALKLIAALKGEASA